MTFKLSSPSLFQHFAWIPLRIFTTVFCSFKVKGLENIKENKGNVIIASNHGSELDPLMVVAALPFFSHMLPLAFVSRDKTFYSSHRRGFLYGGRFFKIMGAYPAYSGLNDYDKALENHISAIEKGESVCIFPLGKKHKPDELNKARGGVSFLAFKTGRPIVPVLIEGLGGYRIRDYLMGKTKITITFGEPIHAKDIFFKPLSAETKVNHKHCEKAAVNLMKKIYKLN